MAKPELEARLEDRCVAKIEARGGLALKLVIPGVRGFPDRTVCMPGRRVWFFETKRIKTGRLSAQQSRWFGKLEALGFSVWLIDNDADFDAALDRELSR